LPITRNARLVTAKYQYQHCVNAWKSKVTLLGYLNPVTLRINSIISQIAYLPGDGCNSTVRQPKCSDIY